MNIFKFIEKIRKPRVRVIISLSEARFQIARARAKNGRLPRHHETAVKSLIAFIGADIAVADVTAQQILAWYGHIKSSHSTQHSGKKLSAWTVDNYARMLKAFFSNCVKMGYLSESPCGELVLPRLPKKARKDITEGDIAKLVAHARWSPRDYALVLVLRDTGCRVGGMVSMRACDVKIRTGEDGVMRGRVIVYEKMNKGRIVYFGHEACHALQIYMEARPATYDELWLSHKFTPLRGDGVYQALERIAKRAGVERFNPHAFRHALAKRLVARGTPMKAVADLMGHEDVTTTMTMYVTYDDDELDAIHEKYSGR